MVLSCIISDIKREIGQKFRFFFIPPAFVAPVRGSRRNIAIVFGLEKLEWCGYPTVKKFDDTLLRLAVLTQYRRVTDRHLYWTGPVTFISLFLVLHF